MFLIFAAACGASACVTEDPARAALRARLEQSAQLSNDELGQLRAEVIKSMAGKTFMKAGAGAPDIDVDQRAVVFGMLDDPIGMFDEGVRERDGTRLRVLNAPGVSNNAEIEASRRLFIDIDTFLPRRFEFAYAFSGLGDYGFDLAVAR